MNLQQAQVSESGWEIYDLSPELQLSNFASLRVCIIVSISFYIYFYACAYLYTNINLCTCTYLYILVNLFFR